MGIDSETIGSAQEAGPIVLSGESIVDGHHGSIALTDTGDAS